MARWGLVGGARLDVWSGRSLLTTGLRHGSFNATSALMEPAYDWVRLGVTIVLGVVAVSLSGKLRRTRVRG